VGREAATSSGRVALIHGRSFAANPGAATVTSALAAAGGVEVVTEIEAHGEPDDGSVLEAARTVRAAGVTVIVAVGGGSTIDLAKAAAVVAGLGDDALRSLLEGRRVEERVGPPVVALPTTAGSGAEVSHGAIVLDRAAGRKRGIRGSGVSADVALVDPGLVASADAETTAAAGLDAIAHAIETALSRAASPLARTLSADALGRLLRNVPCALTTPDDAEARAETAYGALLMGMNLAISTTCLPHRLQYPVGALTGTRHAAGVAAILPAWLRRMEQYAPDVLGDLAIAAGLAEPEEAGARAASALTAAIDRHLAITGFAPRLGNLGVAAGDIRRLVAAVEGTLTNDPGPVGPADLAELYMASL
jgi:alcohol dehydrogenase class IV